MRLDDVVEFGMEDWLAAADGDNRCSEPGELIEALEHGLQRNRLADRVELIAVGTGQIASAHGNDVSHHHVIGVDQSMGDHAQLPQAPAGGGPLATKPLFLLRHSRVDSITSRTSGGAGKEDSAENGQFRASKREGSSLGGELGGHFGPRPERIRAIRKALVYNPVFALYFSGAYWKMIRFLQTKGRFQKILLVGFLSIVCIMMVVTLVPGGVLGDFGGRGVSANAVAKVDGQDVTIQEVDQVARNMMQRQHIPEQFKSLHPAAGRGRGGHAEGVPARGKAAWSGGYGRRSALRDAARRAVAQALYPNGKFIGADAVSGSGRDAVQPERAAVRSRNCATS